MPRAHAVVVCAGDNRQVRASLKAACPSLCQLFTVSGHGCKRGLGLHASPIAWDRYRRDKYELSKVRVVELPARCNVCGSGGTGLVLQPSTQQCRVFSTRRLWRVVGATVPHDVTVLFCGQHICWTSGARVAFPAACPMSTSWHICISYHAFAHTFITPIQAALILHKRICSRSPTPTTQCMLPRCNHTKASPPTQLSTGLPPCDIITILPYDV